MNYTIPHESFATCEEMRRSFSSSDQKDSVLCPKPRRGCNLLTGAVPIRPVRVMNISNDSPDVMDAFLTEGCSMASSPPFFFGSPPSRSANPLIHDTRFLEEKTNTPSSPLSVLPSRPSTPPGRKAGFFRAATNFGPLPAAVRIEGFDCLDRDRRGCGGIPAFA